MQWREQLIPQSSTLFILEDSEMALSFSNIDSEDLLSISLEWRWQGTLDIYHGTRSLR